ncbi:MAG: Uma2 family endonuclease [Limnothrix sp.]
MIALTFDQYMTPEEYLEFEKTSDIKHEYIDGEIYAMAGTGKFHNIISGNLYILLRNSLRNSDCQTFIADVKVKLEEGRRFFYPDLLVTCDPTDDPNDLFVTTPKVIIEILSPSTASFDRDGKFQLYRTIPSLREYILVSAETYSVECFRRQTQDIWTVQFYENIAAIAYIEALDINAPLSEIYATVEFTEPEAQP